LDFALKKKTTEEVEEAFQNSPGMKVEILEEPPWGPTLKRGSLSRKPIDLAAGTYVLVFYAKGDQLETMKAVLSNSVTDLSDSSKRELNGDDLMVKDRWTKYEIPLTLAETDHKAFIYLEFLMPRQNEGNVVLSDIGLFRRDAPETK
jgi:hypothetical protein